MAGYLLHEVVEHLKCLGVDQHLCVSKSHIQPFYLERFFMPSTTLSMSLYVLDNS